MAEGSPRVMVLGEWLVSIPLIPSITRGGVAMGMSWLEGSVVPRASGESSLALTSVGRDSPAWGEALLRWTNPWDPALMLFTLDDAAESMERESLDVGIVSVLEALDHAWGALRNVVVPSSRVFA